jgi:hypothetical protein
MPTIVIERVLDSFDAVKAQRVCAFSQGDALLVVIGRAAVAGSERREKIDAKFHGVPL